MRTLQSMLAYEAKRRPEIAEMIDNIRTLDIDAAIVPLPWFKNALREMKNTIVVADTKLAMEAFIVDGFNPDPMGEMREWTDIDGYIKTSRGAEYQIRYGDILWVADDGHVEVKHVYLPGVDPIIFLRSRVIRKISKLKYREVCDKETPPVVTETTPGRDYGLFKITRIP